MSKEERGITLVALIITIIILIILAAIGIRTVIGDHGLFQMAQDAAEKTRIEGYREELVEIGAVLAEDQVFDDLKGREYLEKFQEKVEESEKFKNKRSSDIMEGEDGEEEKLRIVTQEGYVFDVTEDEVIYVGKMGEKGLEPLPNIQDESIVIDAQPTDWTNDKVIISIKINENMKEELKGLIIQYTTDETGKTGWKKYDENNKPEMTTNGTIIARLKNSIGEASKYTATETITNIDTIKPKDPEVTITETTSNSIKITAKAKDEEAKAEEGKPGEESGIAKIIYEIEGIIGGEQKTERKEIEVGEIEKEREKEEVVQECIFEGLNQKNSYNVKVIAIDRAKNESKEIVKEGIETEEIPGGSTEEEGGVIQFNYDPDPKTTPWTNGKVKVIITSEYTNKGYTLEWTKETPTSTTIWNEYNKIQPEMESNGTIYARLKDSRGQTGATGTGKVTNIDTAEPTKPSITITGTTTNNKNYTTDIGVTIAPGEETGEVQSGISGTTYSITGTKGYSDTGTITSGENKTATLTVADTYTITATTRDNAGNTSTETKTVIREIAIKDITLEPTSVALNLTTKKTAQLTATIEPSSAGNQVLKWESSNPGVATVTQTGLVTAITNGTTSITVKSQDGSNIEKTCNVIVSAWRTATTRTENTAIFDGTIPAMLKLASGGTGVHDASYLYYDVPTKVGDTVEIDFSWYRSSGSYYCDFYINTYLSETIYSATHASSRGTRTYRVQNARNYLELYISKNPQNYSGPAEVYIYSVKLNGEKIL